MSRRMTINIAPDVSDVDALLIVSRTVEKGRISGDGTTYCYGLVIPEHYDDGTQLSLSSHRTMSGNDSFHVWRRGVGMSES